MQCEKIELLLEIPSLKHGADMNETQFVNCGEAYLLKFHDALSQCFTHYCTMIAEYLNEFDDAYNLLAEYTTRVGLILNFLVVKAFKII